MVNIIGGSLKTVVEPNEFKIHEKQEIYFRVNYSELRQNLKANLDAVTDNSELLVVQRPKGRSIVMMSPDEYNSL